MQYFPLFTDLNQRRVIVVGGGEVAERKVELMLRANPLLTLIAPELSPRLQALQQAQALDWRQQSLSLESEPSWHADARLVVMATNDARLNREWALRLEAQGVLVNVVDDPDACNVITPAMVDRGKLLVAISSAGAAPVLASQLRAEIEQSLPASSAELMEFVAGRREQVKQALPANRRAEFWRQFFALNGRGFSKNTQANFDRTMAEDKALNAGELWLMDAEIEPNLLPIAALEVLAKLDCVISVLPLNGALNDWVRRDASRVTEMSESTIENELSVGKRLLFITDEQQLKFLKERFSQARTIQTGQISPSS
ncbi:precorrin-2 dehydrogenase/sirohydrochlorin ferrochelatase family protein [Paraferrimonas sedimenticola]|uniref:precorrin-2 dehydrogenase n=1 Tax=Paraferrimonas sedimenticola TaxID=375674 RepID=A0AA37RR54_9GAMM|nr:bifunctional precorrin-2 dehydrogenase/sirohydrochlorin ferrochelatase [Paraferrimonas sedimenticola]GLP95195.1 siroheme synthase [Paraferrimonas sedimenticola]